MKAVDFFCSGGGMSYGMHLAGIEVLAGIDFDPLCKDTYEANLPNSKYILADITQLTVEDLQKHINIKQNDNELILIGCSPCQYWTIINTNKSKSQKSKNLLHDFKRFVDYYNPGYVVVENVPGILSKDHESGINEFIDDLKAKGYLVESKWLI